jgi:fluoroacetyl-CoA thioesterase
LSLADESKESTLKPEFGIGVSAELEEVTTEEMGVRHLGTGVRSVFSTPSMIAMMERTSIHLIKPYLEEGEGSVGTKVNISHIAATPIGMKVHSKSTVKEINGRRVVFAVEVHNEKEKIGEGTHERAIINIKKFAEKA